MSTVLFEIIQDINQYFCQSSPVSDQRQISSRFQRNCSGGKRYDQEKVLIKELKSLKLNVENLYQHCQSLENQNRVLKRIVSRSNESFSTYSSGKTSFFGENSINKKQSNKYFSKVQNSDYFTEFSRQSQNSHKIQALKNELAGLSNNLISMTKKFQKYDLDSTNGNESKDLFVSESSFNTLGKKSQNGSQQIDLETLLCHQQLSFDDTEFHSKVNPSELSQKTVIDSLIAKGIEFRQSRALKSKQFQSLNHIIQQYRSQLFQTNLNKPIQKQSCTLKYR